MTPRRSSGDRRPRTARLPVLALALGMTALGAGAAPAGADAQEDFRNLDRGRPLLTEDAHPVKLREWELELGTRGRWAEEGSGAEAVLELKTGLFLNTQAGVELEGVVEDGADGAASGLESAGVHLLYNVSRETWSWPAVAVRLDARSPGAGEAGREDWGGRITGIATRSFGRTRLHANAGYEMASGADRDDVWVAGLAVDHPVGLFSRAVMGDVFVEVPVEGGRTRVWLEAGTRWQLTNVSVLDLGVATRLDEWEAGRANLELVVGLSRVFGIPGWVDVPPYPDPRID